MATQDHHTGPGPEVPKRLLLMGPPGSGKGTVGAALAEWLGVPHVSSGRLLRATIEAGDPHNLGPHLAAGGFAPDDLVTSIVTARLGDGFILDGYPRTAEQAVMFDKVLAGRGLDLQAVLDLDVPDDEVRARIARRARIEGRADDNPATVEARLAIWHREAGALRQHYRDRVHRIDGVGEVDVVVERARAALRAAGRD